MKTTGISTKSPIEGRSRGVFNTKSPIEGRFRGGLRGGRVFFLLLFTLLSTLTAGAYTGVRLTQNTGYLFLNDSEIEITGTGGPNTRLYIAHEGTVTLRNVNITSIDAANHWPAIYCSRDVTIILEGKNKVYSGHASYPAIEIVAGKTLTIIGDGSLDARSPYGSPGGGAAIGGEVQSKCGNIIIEGGTIDARSGTEGAGIGGGGGSIDNNKSHCGYIAIGMGVKSVTASGGFNAIGAGYRGSCGTVTIGGNVVGSTGSYYSYTPPTDYHTLHFDANGGTGGTPNQYAVDATPFSVASCLFTRENSRFTGWNTAADGSGTAYAEGETVTLSSDITLYAQWEHIPVTYKIFEEDNVSLFLEEGDVLTGGGFGDSQATIADGATVTFRDVDLCGLSDEIFPRITCQGDATIILSGTNEIMGGEESAGIYVPKGHTLTIRGDGSLTARGQMESAGIGGGMNQSCGNIIITNEVAFVTAKAGSSSSAKISIGQGTGNNLSCGTVTIGGIETGPIAQNPFTYNPSTIYTVSFDANGGSGTMAGQSFRWGTPQSLNACTFTAPEDDSFFGWNTAADGSGTAYDDGQTININHDMTLYAQWAIPVWVGNSQVTSVNRHDILGDGTTSFDPETNTLTLDHPKQDVAIRSEGIDLTVKGVYQMSDAAGDVALDVVGGSLTLDGDFMLRGAVTGVQVGGNMNVKGQLRAYGTSGSGIHYTGTDNAWLTLQQGFFGDTRVEMQGGDAALSYEDDNVFRITTNGYVLSEPADGIVSSSDNYFQILTGGVRATRAVVTLAGTANGKGTEASPFQINSSDDWTMACADVANGCETAGRYFQINTSITATAMMGRPDNPFAGVIDGQRNFFKVTAAINQEVEGAALFRAVSGATIKNFCVEGTVNGGAASGGIVGQAVGGTTTMENSVFNGTVSATTGAPAGNFVVGDVASGATVTYNNCLDATHLLWPATDSRAYSVTGVDATLTLTGTTGITWNDAIYAPEGATVAFTLAGSYGAYVATDGTLTKSDGTYSLVMPAQNVAIIPEASVTYAITGNNPTGGTVEITRSKASAGTPVYVTATPDPYWLLGELTVRDANDNEIAMTMYDEDFGFFTMPSGPVTVTVTFNKKYSFENGELRLLCGDFNFLGSNGFGPDVTDNKDAVLKVTAAEGVRFTGTCAELFKDFTSCTEIDLSNVNTSAMTHTTSMFKGCTSLKKLNMTGWDMQRVEHMDEMFYDCKSLRELDLSGFNLNANVSTTMMFLCNDGNTSNPGVCKLTLPAGFGVTASMGLRRGYYKKEYGVQTHSGWQLLGDKTIVSGSDTYDGYTFATLPAQSTAATYVWTKMPEDFVLELPDGEDNSKTIADWDGVTTNVQLTGRKLWKDGDWNTICLPFMLGASEILNFFGNDTDIRGLDIYSRFNAQNQPFVGDEQDEEDFPYQTGFDETTGTLRLYFTPQYNLSEIMPGEPYLIKWPNDANHPYFESPTFTGVTIDISSDDANVSKTVTSEDGTVTFTGTYDPIAFTSENRSVLFLGTNNNLYYPDGTATTTINAFRAYFQLNGITAGDPSNPSSSVKAFVLNFGEEGSADAINAPLNDKRQMINDNAWYDLSGRRLGGKPTQKGIYIHNGKKIFK